MKLIAIFLVLIGVGLLIWIYMPRYAASVNGIRFRTLDEAMNYAKSGDIVKIKYGTHYSNWEGFDEDKD